MISAPVQLGEYLDDEQLSVSRVVERPATVVAAAPIAAPVPVPTRTARPDPESRVVHFPRPEPASPPIAERPVAPEAPLEPEAFPQLHEFQPAKKQTRKQVNMNPETLQMVEELVDQICEQCVQRDVKASELFHALVSTLYEAREHLDFSQVKPRGKWGSPTAKAFPVSLKNAFRAAVALAHAPTKR
jgi:hypothetical protein